ncbi:hypothetical protein ACFUJY_15310 [Streptomyces sp. NPDC057249]|uniref:hypothetical protein n=1 Tax=Streptomyces sp. NPDC057249 TaxID=3346067 RepID=UPI003632785C
MATEWISISMPSEVGARIRQHAAEAGLSVSAYMMMAAQAQMDRQDRVRKVFAPFEEACAEADEHAGSGTWAGDEIELTREQRAEVALLWEETRYLLRSPANARRLRASIAEAAAEDGGRDE